ncbi:MAG: uroporphyrinogen decarboxylase family protein [Oscillospiraceae bacterium]|jgi:uroporphyrinogen decarboxylase|nr:uroporphyrinogen decarboxylase family protein [Oscillospiraceae bacterium]
MRKPDFGQLLKVLDRQAPDRPVLFELFIDGPALRYATQNGAKTLAGAYALLGYDYASVVASDFGFPSLQGSRRGAAKTFSLNDSPVITGRGSFDAYPWMDPRACGYSRLEDDLPPGMKLMARGPCGVLENTIRLVGYDNLCLMLYDDPRLASDIFERVGRGLVEYYRIAAQYDSVGLLMCNDDWGFNRQTMLSPADMRKYVFPWHREIVGIAHGLGKPAALHSCGNFSDITDDLFGMGFDGRHSYEDNILPVEEAYELLMGGGLPGGKMAVLGGVDLHFLCTATPEEIKARARTMLQRASGRGGYALGSGNSVPEYCPIENYLAMISVIDEG